MLPIIQMVPPPGAPAVNSVTGLPANSPKKVPIMLRKLTPKELDVFIHLTDELTSISPYFAPIIRQVRPAIINSKQASIDKDWRIGLPEGSLDTYRNAETLKVALREILRIIILQDKRIATRGYKDDEVTRLAFDLEINQRISGISGRFRLTPGIDFVPADYNLPSNGIAEEFHNALREDAHALGQQGSGGGSGSAESKPQSNESNSSTSEQQGNDSSQSSSLSNGGGSGEKDGQEGDGTSNTNNEDTGSSDTSGGNPNSETSGSDSGETPSSGNQQSNGASDGDNGALGGNDGTSGEAGSTDGNAQQGKFTEMTDQFVTAETLQSLMDALGIQAADELIKRESRNDMLALVRAEQMRKSIGNTHLDNILNWVLKIDAGNYVVWFTQLKKVLAIASSHRTTGSTHRTFRKFNRLNAALPDKRVLLPTRYAVKPTVYIGVDTSGSMHTREDSGRVLGNIERIIDSFKNRADLRISAIDTVLGDFQPVKKLSDVVFKGGGGTAMAPFIHALNEYETSREKKNPPAALGILITDGYIDWQNVANALKCKHNYGLAIVLTSKHSDKDIMHMHEYFKSLPANCKPTIIRVAH
jgi:PREDICTED: similar to predicted protein